MNDEYAGFDDTDTHATSLAQQQDNEERMRRASDIIDYLFCFVPFYETSKDDFDFLRAECGLPKVKEK